jgi:hypothetical protein
LGPKSGDIFFARWIFFIVSSVQSDIGFNLSDHTFKSNSLFVIVLLLTGNIYPRRSDSIGGLPEPGGSLAYTWRDSDHEGHVSTLKGKDDLLFGALPFALLDELYHRFLANFETGNLKIKCYIY